MVHSKEMTQQVGKSKQNLGGQKKTLVIVSHTMPIIINHCHFPLKIPLSGKNLEILQLDHTQVDSHGFKGYGQDLQGV